MNHLWPECLQEAEKAAQAAAGHGSLDSVVDAANRLLLRRMGVTGPGQVVRVTTGRWAGLTGPIGTVNWSAAEVRIKGCARWFDCWRTAPTFEVVDLATVDTPDSITLTRTG